MRYRNILALIACIIVPFLSYGQILDPVKWNVQLDKTGDTEAIVMFSAQIEDGWHLYSTNLPEGGPIPTSINWTDMKNVKPIGHLTFSKAPHQEVDLVYNLELGWWTNNVTIYQKVQIANPNDYHIAGYVRYMVCNDGTCQAPKNYDFEFKSSGTVVEEQSDTLGVVSAQTNAGTIINDNADTEIDYWKPVSAVGEKAVSMEQQSFWYIFIGGFLGGLLALLTPCVWPMIPLTVSFFLKRHGSRRKAITDAVIYGISIVVIYLALGIIITLIFGPQKLNDLATNAWFNILFFLLLVVFAISFFGAFEITLPSKWTNKMNNKAETATGLLSIFFMAFTLILVSFSCTGPIIGTLLVEAVSLGDLTGPAIGMGAFALALAIPFSLFAVFPTWLNGLPKSGGWLNSVKVVLGFIELALSLKFLSVADLAYGWRILDREVFISLWIVIFALLGLYLIGKLRFKYDSKCESIGILRFFLALISFSFAIYLLPGLWGAPLRSVSAFTPPLTTQDFNMSGDSINKVFDNYDEGMDAASKAGKPVFLEFSGYGCVNCRKMEAAVIDKDIIKNYLRDNFVTIKVMVDDRKELDRVVKVMENGSQTTLRTYGDLWSYLERYKFGSSSQPYYVVLDNSGEIISGPTYYDHEENVDKFHQFLKNGLDRFKSLNNE